jgi:tRNA-guanine family transglycosylase
MQLDDVLPSTAVDRDRFVEATDRTVRWLDRALTVHQHRKDVQNLFPIVQGGLDLELRYIECFVAVAIRMRTHNRILV